MRLGLGVVAFTGSEKQHFISMHVGAVDWPGVSLSMFHETQASSSFVAVEDAGGFGKALRGRDLDAA